MGQNTMNFPQIQGVMTIGWNDNNLRIGSIDWEILVPATVQVDIYRMNISPDPVVTRIINSPDAGSENVPGNLRMEEYTDPEYPEEGTRLRWPDGLTFNFSVA